MLRKFSQCALLLGVSLFLVQCSEDVIEVASCNKVQNWGKCVEYVKISKSKRDTMAGICRDGNFYMGPCPRSNMLGYCTIPNYTIKSGPSIYMYYNNAHPQDVKLAMEREGGGCQPFVKGTAPETWK